MDRLKGAELCAGSNGGRVRQGRFMAGERLSEGSGVWEGMQEGMAHMLAKGIELRRSVMVGAAALLGLGQAGGRRECVRERKQGGQVASSGEGRGRLGDVAGREHRASLHDGHARRWSGFERRQPPYRALLSTGRGMGETG